jgi:hypothetical protein
MGGSKLALTINLTPEPAEVLIDKHALESILCDVVLHARLAMPRGRLAAHRHRSVGIRPGSNIPF